MHLRSMILSIVCGLVLPACATPGPPVWTPLSATKIDHSLTLEECVKLALETDVNSAQWKARLDMASAELTGAKTLPNPSFSASWEDLGIKDAEGVALKNATYGISYPVLFWITHGKQIKAAQSRAEAEKASVRADKQQVATEVGTAYFTILADQRRERATEGVLEQTRAGLQLSEELFKLGAGSGHDVDVARADVLQAEADLDAARRQTLHDRLAFAFALGADRPVTVQIEDTEVKLPAEFTAADKDARAEIPQALLDRTLSVDPAYSFARSAREAAEAEYQIEVRRAIPLADAEVGVAGKDAPEGTAHNVSVDVPIPVFDWNRGGIKRARADLLEAQTQEEMARRNAVANLSESWQGYTTARTQYDKFWNQVASQRAKLAGDAQDLFAAGQIDYIELVKARSDWHEAEIAAAESWRDCMIAEWELICRTESYEEYTGVQ